MTRIHRRLASVIVAVGCVITAGCSATSEGTGVAAAIASPLVETPTRTQAPEESSTAATVTTSPARSTRTEPAAPQSGGVYVEPADCLMSVDEVSAVLGGVWTREENSGGSCTYASDRGAQFAITPIDYAPDELEDAMASARQFNCDSEPIDVPDTDGGFVCLETVDGIDYVDGNLVAQNHFWLFLIILQDAGPDHSQETEAVVALLGAARQ